MAKPDNVDGTIDLTLQVNDLFDALQLAGQWGPLVRPLATPRSWWSGGRPGPGKWPTGPISAGRPSGGAGVAGGATPGRYLPAPATWPGCTDREQRPGVPT